MFLHTLLWLFMLLQIISRGVISYCVDDIFEKINPTILDIYENDYVSMLVGNPGEMLNFKINFTSHDIQIHKSLNSISQTFEIMPNGIHGSEIFYIGKYTFRLPVKFISFNPEPITQLISSNNYDGTIGLGELSPIWKFWRSATFSTRSIILGIYDPYTQLDYTIRPPLFRIPDKHYSNKNDNDIICSIRKFNQSSAIIITDNKEIDENLDVYYSLYHFGNTMKFSIDAGKTNTYIPRNIDLFDQGDELLLESQLDCHEEYTKIGINVSECTNTILLKLNSQNITLKNQKEFITVQQIKDEQQQDFISIGRQFIIDYTMFYNWDTQRTSIVPSVFAIYNSSINTIFSIILVTMISLWLLIMLNNKIIEKWLFVGVIVLEMVFYVTSLTVFLINMFVFKWSRFVTHIVRGDSSPVFIYIIYNLIVSFIGSIILLLRNVKLYDDRNGNSIEQNFIESKKNMMNVRNLRILLFVSNSLSILWFCVLPYQQGISDIVYIATFAFILCLTSTVITMHSIFWSRKYVSFMFFQTLLHYVFLVIYNIVPISRLYYLNKSYNENLFHVILFSLYLLFVFIFFPATIIFAKAEITLFNRKQTKHLISYYKRQSLETDF